MTKSVMEPLCTPLQAITVHVFLHHHYNIETYFKKLLTGRSGAQWKL